MSYNQLAQDYRTQFCVTETITTGGGGAGMTYTPFLFSSSNSYFTLDDSKYGSYELIVREEEQPTKESTKLFLHTMVSKMSEVGGIVKLFTYATPLVDNQGFVIEWLDNLTIRLDALPVNYGEYVVGYRRI